MAIYTLRCEMLTHSSIEDTFKVFEDPCNLARITPRWLKFHVTSPQPVTMREGAEIEYTIRWLGLPIHWKTEILEYQPPFLFVDNQAKGPYSLWRHRHTFESAPDGTRVGDHVDYALPWGPLGRLAHATMVRRQLLGIFSFRQQELRKVFGNNATQIVKPYVTKATD